MNLSLVVLAAWWSAVLAPIEPVDPKTPSPVVEPIDDGSGKPPRVTQPPKISFTPGIYSRESLKLPDILPIEKIEIEAWQPGPDWPYVEDAVVVVIEHPQDPYRFLAFLVDVRKQRFAAAREGDQAKHLATIGHMRPSDFGKDGQTRPHTIMDLAGSGAVIILKPPPPPGPNGLPDDLRRRMLDSASLASQAARWIGGGKLTHR